MNGTAANSSELGGQPASAYLTTSGTAANSNELGGIGPSGFIQGSGTTSDNRLLERLGQNPITFLSGAGSYVSAECEVNGGAVDDQLNLVNNSSGPVGAIWWNKDGVGGESIPVSGSVALNGPNSAYVVVVQVDTGSSISTYTMTTNTDFSSECYFTGNVVTSNG